MNLKVRIFPTIIRMLITLFGITWRAEYSVHPQPESGFIYAFWHRYIIPLTWLYRKQDIGIVISQSTDGEIISRTVEKMGFGPIRGSSSRGGSAALRETVRRLRSGKVVAITPDGPRGPIYVADKGLAYAAKVAERPVLPVCVTARPAILLSSWDRMLIPLPFAKVHVTIEAPIYPEKDEDVDHFLNRVQTAMNELENNCSES